MDEGGHLFESCIKIIEPPRDGNIAQELLKTLSKHPDRTLVVDAPSGRRWSGAKLLDLCTRIATCLIRQVGVQANDVAMTICDRDDTEIIIALAATLAGAAIYPTMPVDGYSEAALLCELAQPRVLIVNDKYHERALKLCQNVAGMRDTKIVCIDDLGRYAEAALGAAEAGGEKELADENNNDAAQPSGSQTIWLDEVLLRHNCDPALVHSVARDRIKSAEHIFSLLLTSGSTGRPKVVPATHEEMLWSLYSMVSAASVPMERKTEPADENNNETQPDYLLSFGGDDVVAGDLPLDHGAGLNIMLLSLMLGAKYIVMPSFEPERFWRAVSEHRITFSITSTAFSFALFKCLKRWISDGTAAKVDLSCLANMTCCGAKMSFVELAEEIQSHLQNLAINQGYGCTENGYISSGPRFDVRAGYIESVGYLFPGVTAKVVDPNDLNKQLGPNQRGELLIRSRSLFKGYRCHPEADAYEVFKNCHDAQGIFYRTGDQVHFDEAGRLYVHGRYKDTLVLAGDWKIMPAELEDVVNAHPLVDSSAVVGLVDPEMPTCHKPRAFVKLVKKTDKQRLDSLSSSSGKESAQLLERFLAGERGHIAEHIESFVADRVAPAKRLTGGVRILDEFPRVGLLNKVDRKALRDMA